MKKILRNAKNDMIKKSDNRRDEGNAGLYYYSEQYSGYAEGMAGGTGRSGDSSEVYNGRKNLYRYGRLTPKEFFGKLREGKMSVTSQVNPEEAKEMLEPFVKEGKDVLHLSFSSGLSGTANSMRMAAEELSEEYPERKILQWIRFAPAWEKDFFYIKRCS